ncbi:hypothetical protein GCM10018793_23520 [Streptomyces sulfonofaciens]|uniref:PAS domain-containing protein n=1 Tax=Streptomyces sulfonofaciens TaxID=68272 RepID=A0A919G472_9ACTN|nr:SpoIIE family protein phosphatase [Streptomyces sulfonofaciens]GHH76845.1 hypothetical protein GCM10018793_23520 [Streptomyces sulfonofaciens]
MNAPSRRPDDQGFCFPVLGAVVVDGAGTVVGWSDEAARLLALPPQEVCGRPLAALLDEGERWGAGSGAVPEPGAGRVRLRRGGDGGTEVAFRVTGLGGTAGDALILFAPAERVREWGQGVSVLHAVLDQNEVGLALRDSDLVLERTNITPEMFGGPAVEPGRQLGEVVWAQDATEAEAVLGQVLATGEPVISRQHVVRSGGTPPRERTVSLSAFRMKDAYGEPSGVAAVVEDVTEQERIRKHRDLLHDAATRIGFSLDVRRTAQALADVVHGLADLVTVDLDQAVLEGDEPPPGQAALVRAAVAAAGEWPEKLLGVGGLYPTLPDSDQVRRILEGHSLLLSRQEVVRALADGPLVELLVPEHTHSLVVSPLYARGSLLGTLTSWRTERSPAYDEDELELLAEVSSRAALGIDNARRYAHEHRAAVALQERLLPRAVTDSTAAHTVGAYAPAGGGAGVGGDWFDVIALPSLRVAFVVGDVVGHGLPAAAAMGRLRTAVQNFAVLELEPAEVLAHMEDLVQRLAAESPPTRRDSIGATCMYAVYDPTNRQCVFASAGQPPPVLVRPDGSTALVRVPLGPPLGVGAEPFESTTITLDPDSVLALFTDGLLALEPYAGGDGPRRVEEKLAELSREQRTLEDIGDELLADADRTAPRDDVAVLLARTHVVDPCSLAGWEFPAEPESVAKARTAAAHQLESWGLGHLAFTTELVVSELVTNAVRYAWGPIGLRLIRDEVLICEVTDPSNTQPRLMRAGGTDEGGRGLFIVAQCTTRWGCRYGRRGKTIWTEQPLRGTGDTLGPYPEVA